MELFKKLPFGEIMFTRVAKNFKITEARVLDNSGFFNVFIAYTYRSIFSCQVFHYSEFFSNYLLKYKSGYLLKNKTSSQKFCFSFFSCSEANSSLGCIKLQKIFNLNCDGRFMMYFAFLGDQRKLKHYFYFSEVLK